MVTGRQLNYLPNPWCTLRTPADVVRTVLLLGIWTSLLPCTTLPATLGIALRRVRMNRVLLPQSLTEQIPQVTGERLRKEITQALPILKHTIAAPILNRPPVKEVQTSVGT